MNDFLANIVEKSLTTELAIRPRPMSLFEPVQAKETTGFAHQPQAEQDHRAPESDAVRTVSMAPVAMTTKELPVGQDEGHPIAMQAPRLGVSATIADPQPAGSTPAEQPAGQGKYQPAAETISPAFETRRNPLRESPDGHQTVSPSKPPATEMVINPTGQNAEVINYQPIEIAETMETISERTLVKPVIKRFETDKLVTSQIPLQPIGRLQSNRPTTWGQNNEPMQQQLATPTIQVTIGRVEVRATTSPPQNRAREKAPVSMSLDEYLLRRNGGGR